MAGNTTEPPVIVTSEERPHPALRKLGRACIALVRWQRGELDGTTSPSGTSTAPDISTTPTTAAPVTEAASETGVAHG